MDSVWILTWNPSGFPEGLDTALLLCNEHDKREMFQFQKLYKKKLGTYFRMAILQIQNCILNYFAQEV